MIDTDQEIAVQPERAPAKELSGTVWLRLLLLMALTLGVFFRLAGLGHKIYSHDEAFTSLTAAGYSLPEVYNSLWDGQDKTANDIQKFLEPGKGKGISDTFTILRRDDPHEGPIFFLLAYSWMRAVGGSPAAMRGLSTLFSLLTLPALYWLGKELFSPRAAILATIFFALSPYQILFAQDARPYSLWTLATLLSSASLLYAMRKNQGRAWLLYSLTLIFGIYSHALFSLVAIVHALYFAGKNTLLSAKKVSGFLFAAALAFFAFIPWLSYILIGWDESAERMAWVDMQISGYRYIQRWMLNFSSPFLDLDIQSNMIPYMLRALLLVLVAIAWIFFLKHGTFQQKKFLLWMFLLPAGFLIIPDLLQGGIRSIGGRYFVPASIVTIFVMVYFLISKLDQAPHRMDSRWKILIGVLLIASILSDINILFAKTWWDKELSRVSPQFVELLNQDRAVLIVTGYSPTNVGDVLLLSLHVHPSMHFRLYEDPNALQIPDDVQNIYWMPSSYNELQEVSTRKQLKIRNAIPWILWKIDGVEH